MQIIPKNLVILWDKILAKNLFYLTTYSLLILIAISLCRGIYLIESENSNRGNLRR